MKKIVFAIFIIIILLTGCTNSKEKEMSTQFRTYFSDSSNKLKEELYNDIYQYVDYDDYRLAVFQSSWNDTGEFTIQRVYSNPIDLDKINQIKVNDVYYDIN